MEWLWAVIAVLVFAPAIIYQTGRSMKEMREVKLEEMKQRSELDSKILGLDTASSEIKVELATIREEIAELKQMIVGGSRVGSAQPTMRSQTEAEQSPERREIPQTN